MKPLALVLAFAPLVAFSVLARLLPAPYVAVAALVALATLLVVHLVSGETRRPSLFTVVQGLVFLVLGVLGMVLGRHGDTWLRTWAGGGVALVIGLVLVALSRTRPFTASFSRQVTPQAYWSAPTFIRINRVLSLVWGCAICAIGLCRIAATAVDRQTSAPAVVLALGVLAPVAIVIGTLRFSGNYYWSVQRKGV